MYVNFPEVGRVAYDHLKWTNYGIFERFFDSGGWEFQQ